MTDYLKQLSKYHFHIYYGCLVLLGLSLSFSRFMISVSMFALAINWILEGNFNNKWNTLRGNKSILVFCSFYLMMIIAMVYSDNFSRAVIAIRKLLPMLILPIVIGTSQKLTYKQLKIFLMLFIMGVFAHTLMSTALFTGVINLPGYTENGNIAYFYSHIRFALMIVFSIFCLGYFIFYDKIKIIKHEKLISIIMLIWLIFFLFILNSLTGIFLFFILGIGTTFYLIISTYGILKKIMAFGIITIILLASGLYIYNIHHIYYSTEKINKDTLPEKTLKGNKYIHKLKADATENGNYVWLYYCPKELRKAWNQTSSISYDSLDQKGQKIKYTLIRYMTSKGLKKDAEGVSQLTTKDIKAIEQGLTNYKFNNKIGLFTRVYELIWELDRFQKDHMPKGTITHRLVSYQTALKIIKNHLALGVGTGDIKDAYKRYYKNNKPAMLETGHWIQGHNQFLSVLTSYGLVGLIWFVIALFYPVISRQGFQSYLFTIFFLISVISMFTEHTLKLQIGITFFVFFYAVLLFGSEKIKMKPL